jgi:threonine dehydratase
MVAPLPIDTPPGIGEIDAAARRIAAHVVRTPLVWSQWLADLSGANVWLKLETMQPTGSFKIRGATNAIARLRETRPDVSSVTTASAGNHGIALARAAAAFGIAVRVHLPATAPAVKKNALRQYGATVIEAASYDEAETQAHAEAARPDVTFISAYSHSDVITGAGTAALEMLNERPEIDAFIVPLGGGGLLSGSALVARNCNRPLIVVGVEAAASPVFTEALRAGHPVTVPVSPTLADGLAGNMEPDSQTFGIVRDLSDRVVQVREPSIDEAMRELESRMGVIAEGAGAVGVAALLEPEGLDLRGRTIGIIISGKNR